MSSSREDSSGYDRENSMNTNNKKVYHRHSNQQIQRLEAYFKECPNPDELQRRKLGEELNLRPEQIKFWFQNRRTHAKNQSERADNTALRNENMRIKRENEAMLEALNSLLCPPCGGPRIGNEEVRENDLHKLRFNNAVLRQEYERLSSYVNQRIAQSMPNMDMLANLQGSSSYASTSNNGPALHESTYNHSSPQPCLLRGSYNLEKMTTSPTQPRNPLSLHQLQPLSQMQKMVMSETTVNAISELMSLIRMDEPMWIKSSIDGRLVIDQDTYEKMYRKIGHVKIPNSRFESSKEVVMVPVDPINLVDMFIDAEKWARLFPTIVNESKTIHMLDSSDGQRQKFSMVMYENLHILSPMVPPREFLILRSCQQMDINTWLIADVSCQLPNLDVDFTDLTYFKRPSGCLIQALPNGHGSKVTWIEHVVLNDKSVRTHRLYRDLLYGGYGYGARRWIVTLERMCERLPLTSISAFPATDLAGVVKSVEGRRSVMMLGERMVQNFAWTLKMSEKFDFAQLSVTNNSGVRVSVRTNKEVGQPIGLIVSAGSSLCLPLPPSHVYNFLKNLDIRHHWDVLCQANPLSEVTRFVTGTDHNNCVNILRPTRAAEDNQLMIIQDSFMDALGGMVVYAPVDLHTAYSAASGTVNPSTIPILPSGFVISHDGRPSAASADLNNGTTILTVAFQILVSTPAYSQELNLEDSTATVNTLISSTIQRIKAMLNCEDAHTISQL